MKVIPGELQRRLVVTDLVTKKVKKVVRKKVIERNKVWKLEEDDTRAIRFEGRVGELVSPDARDLWKCFKERVLIERHMMTYVGRTKGGEIKKTHGGGTKT